MSKVKSPQEKKRLAYDRDHVTLAEYPHGFRRTWPRKKAKAQRAARRKVHQALKTTGDQAAIADVRQKRVRKWGSITLRESVRLKQQKRKQMVGAHKARKIARLAMLAKYVEDALQQEVEDFHEEIRAAAYMLVALGRVHVWPIHDLENLLALAISKLEEVKALYQQESPDSMQAVEDEIAVLRSRLKKADK